jgi:uncharacterized OB-fold protein
MSNERPLPIITDDNRPFWAAAREHRLVLPACLDCGKPFFPIGPVCPFCFSARLEWRRMAGRGTVSSFVIYHQAFFAWFRDRLPYAVAQVELEEGPRLNGNVLGVPPSALAIGMRMEVVFEDVTPEVTLPQFRPVMATQA